MICADFTLGFPELLCNWVGRYFSKFLVSLFNSADKSYRLHECNYRCFDKIDTVLFLLREIIGHKILCK